MAMSIEKAVEKGWQHIIDHPDESLPSQCFYLHKESKRLCFVQGEARDDVFKQVTAVLRHVGDGTLRFFLTAFTQHDQGVYVNKRVAARLADWAHCTPEEITVGSSDKGIEITLEYMSQKDAYELLLCNESCECEKHENFRFAPTSCMMQQKLDAFDADPNYKCLVIHFEDEPRRVARVNVWATMAGNFCEVIFGCPCRHSNRVVEMLRDKGIKPLEDYPYRNSTGIVMSINCDGDIGYCDFVGRAKGQTGTQYTLFYEFRNKRCRTTTAVAAAVFSHFCEGCRTWGGGERYVLDCGDTETDEGAEADESSRNYNDYDPEDYGYEDFNYDSVRGFEVDGRHVCSENCASQIGYVRCEHCGEYAKRSEATSVFNSGYYHKECVAEALAQGAIAKCAHCGQYVSFRWAHKSNDGKFFCCYECAERAGYGFAHSYDGFVVLKADIARILQQEKDEHRAKAMAIRLEEEALREAADAAASEQLRLEVSNGLAERVSRFRLPTLRVASEAIVATAVSAELPRS